MCVYGRYVSLTLFLSLSLSLPLCVCTQTLLKSTVSSTTGQSLTSYQPMDWTHLHTHEHICMCLHVPTHTHTSQLCFEVMIDNEGVVMSRTGIGTPYLHKPVPQSRRQLHTTQHVCECTSLTTELTHLFLAIISTGVHGCHDNKPLLCCNLVYLQQCIFNT